MNGASSKIRFQQVSWSIYQQLFTSSNPKDLTTDLDFIPQIVTEDMNDILTGEFQAWEVEAALKQMAPLKAPGPDRMPPLFYHNF